MGFPLLTINAQAMCGHGGQMQFATNPQPKVLLGGVPAVKALPPTFPMTPCANPPPPAGTGPSATAFASVSHMTKKVLSQGFPLLMHNPAPISPSAVPCATPVMVSSPGQMKVLAS